MTEKVTRLSTLISSGDIQRFKDASLCFGHFNVIHPGHIRYFRTARQHGSKLVVGIEGESQLSDIEGIDCVTVIEDFKIHRSRFNAR